MPPGRHDAFAALAQTFHVGRPLNAMLGWFAVLVGAASVPPFERFEFGVVSAAASAFVGILGANALNDVRDLELDRRAHPERPLPRGEADPRVVWNGSRTFLLVAVALGFGAGLATGVLALLLAFSTLGYEFYTKAWGIWGHLHVAANTGAVFLLGAYATLFPFGSVVLVEDVFQARLYPAYVMAALATLLGFARELYKAAEDAPADRDHRATYAVTAGPEAARRAAAATCWALAPVALLPALSEAFGPWYLVAIAPLFLLLVAIPFLGSSDRQRAALKVGMWLGIPPFLLPALLG